MKIEHNEAVHFKTYGYKYREFKKLLSIPDNEEIEEVRQMEDRVVVHTEKKLDVQ